MDKRSESYINKHYSSSSTNNFQPDGEAAREAANSSTVLFLFDLVRRPDTCILMNR